MESTLSKEFADIENELTPDEKAGRFDIKYTTSAKNHIVIELKRPERRATKTELEAQGDKYKRGLRRLLKQQGRSEEQVVIVFLVGNDPAGWEIDENRREDIESLERKAMRVLSYQQLLENARRVYKEYLVKREETDRIQKLLKEIDTTALLA